LNAEKETNQQKGGNNYVLDGEIPPKRVEDLKKKNLEKMVKPQKPTRRKPVVKEGR